jgi:ADP-ribosyl-[dinitrogen reductase] hydrolase
MGQIEKILACDDRALILDRFKGTLVGCAVGDALGAPVEGMPSTVIAEIYGRVTDFLDERFGAGRVTDDTQMTVSLAQSFIEIGRFDLEHAAFKLGRWMQFSDRGVKKARGPGLASATACRRLYEGATPLESGLPSAGNGAAKRVSPVGLLYHHDPQMLKRAAVEQALLTHSEPEAVAGAVAVAFAVSAGIDDVGDVDPPGLLRSIAGFVEGIDEGMAAKIAGLEPFLGVEPGQAFAYTGTGGYVMETVPGALFAVLRSPYDLEQTVVTAVNAGGDTDSLGSMAGAISGAFNGLERIPGRWREGVEGRAYLETLATKLFTLTPGGRPGRRPLL